MYVLCYFGHLDMVGHVMASLDIHAMPGADYLSRVRLHSNNAIERGTAAHRTHVVLSTE